MPKDYLILKPNDMTLELLFISCFCSSRKTLTKRWIFPSTLLFCWMILVTLMLFNSQMIPEVSYSVTLLPFTCFQMESSILVIEICLEQLSRGCDSRFSFTKQLSIHCRVLCLLHLFPNIYRSESCSNALFCEIFLSLVFLGRPVNHRARLFKPTRNWMQDLIVLFLGDALTGLLVAVLKFRFIHVCPQETLTSLKWELKPMH